MHNQLQAGSKTVIPQGAVDPIAVGSAAAPFVVVAVLVAVSISIFPLSEPDESRYALIAQEMVATGDWITPRISGAPFLDKPPLLFWATAAVFEIGGVNPVTARLPIVLSALGCLAATWYLGRRLYGRRVAGLASLILATSPLFFSLGQHLVLDMPLTFVVTASLAAVWIGLRAGSRRWIIGAWVCLGLGVLVKGPVAIVLIGGTTAAYLLTLWDRSAVRMALDPAGVVAAMLIAVPWFVLAEARTPGFLEVFFLRHHLQRFLDPWHHREPWWHLVAAVPVAIFPWSVLATAGGWSRRRMARPSRWSAETRFLVIWAVWTVLFFSLSGSKIVTYILPALPAMALLCARCMASCLEGLRWALGVTGAVAVGLGFVLGVVVVLEFPVLYQNYGSAAPAIGAACSGALLIAGLGVMLLSRLDLVGDALVVLVGGITLLLACSVAGRQFATSYVDLGAAIRAVAGPGDTVVSYDEAVYGIALDAGVRPVFVPARRHRDSIEREALWGERDTAWLERRWRSPDRVVVVLDETDLASLSPRLDPGPRVLARSGDKVAVANFEPTPVAAGASQPAGTASTSSTR